MMNIPPEKLDAMLKTAGQRLGQDPETLKHRLQSGQLDQLGINEQQKKQIGELIRDPQAMAKFFEQPQVKGIVEQLMKGR